MRAKRAKKNRSFSFKYCCQQIGVGAQLDFPLKIEDYTQENLQLSKKVPFNFIASEASKQICNVFKVTSIKLVLGRNLRRN